MAKAKIKLQGAASYSDRSGNHWKKGDQRIVTDEGDIQYYKNQPEFTVTMLQEVKPAAAAKSAPESKTSSGPVVHTAADLKKLSKTALQEIGLDLDLDLVPDELKQKEMITAILDAQEGSED